MPDLQAFLTEFLNKLPSLAAGQVSKAENPWHADRIHTLRKAAEIDAKEPDQFLNLEMCV